MYYRGETAQKYLDDRGLADYKIIQEKTFVGGKVGHLVQASWNMQLVHTLDKDTGEHLYIVVFEGTSDAGTVRLCLPICKMTNIVLYYIVQIHKCFDSAIAAPGDWIVDVMNKFHLPKKLLGQMNQEIWKWCQEEAIYKLHALTGHSAGGLFVKYIFVVSIMTK